MRRSFCTHCACFPAENRNTTALRLRWRRCIQRDMEWCCRAGREIHLEQPEVIRHGNKFGVKIRAESPSLHFIRATVVTEIAPIVGTEQQAKDLIGYIDETGKQDGIWETNIFGKTVEQLVNDGIRTKISMIGEESQEKLQDTMQKIVNDSTGGMVCIII